jgi:hypothetical protein
MNAQPKYYLPGVLNLIAEKLGEEVAVTLAEQKGGVEAYVPATVTEDCELAQVVGFENAQRLKDLLGVGQFIVPLGNIGGTGARNERCRQLYAQGLTHAAIAREVGCHVRTVERATAGMPSPRQNQLPL